jgi:hypothetical protein
VKLLDWWLLAHVDAILVAGTIYTFKYHDPLVFGAWATFATTLATFYHWFTLRDSKTPDAQ